MKNRPKRRHLWGREREAARISGRWAVIGILTVLVFVCGRADTATAKKVKTTATVTTYYEHAYSGGTLTSAGRLAPRTTIA